MSVSITSGAANIALRQLTIPQVKDAPPPERLTTGPRVALPVDEPRASAPSTPPSSINPLTIEEAAPDRSIDPVSRPAVDPIVSFDRDTGLYRAATQPAETGQAPSSAPKLLGSDGFILFKQQPMSNTITFGHIYR